MTAFLWYTVPTWALKEERYFEMKKRRIIYGILLLGTIILCLFMAHIAIYKEVSYQIFFGFMIYYGIRIIKPKGIIFLPIIFFLVLVFMYTAYSFIIERAYKIFTIIAYYGVGFAFIQGFEIVIASWGKIGTIAKPDEDQSNIIYEREKAKIQAKGCLKGFLIFLAMIITVFLLLYLMLLFRIIKMDDIVDDILWGMTPN